jgi:hypothetical protein
MLTIKQVLSWGFETIYTAKQVRAKIDPPQSTPTSAETNFVAFDLDDGSVFKITQGTVYVMNERGKTVGKYFLTGDLGPATPATKPFPSSEATITSRGDGSYAIIGTPA